MIRQVALAAALVTALILPAAAQAQTGERRGSAASDAVDAVTSPLSDLNLRSKEIPFPLQRAIEDVYSLEGATECPQLRTQIAQLEAVLGPDADAEQESDGLLNKGLKTGGNLLSGFIPFRGLVRQLSGANAEAARWEAATYAGVARRSFLKGYMTGLGCLNAEDEAVRSASDVLGLTPPKADAPKSDAPKSDAPKADPAK